MRAFKEFCETENEDAFLDDLSKLRLTDEEARTEICRLMPINEMLGIKSLPKTQRDEIVGKIKEIEGLTQKQITRILGISLSLINRAE